MAAPRTLLCLMALAALAVSAAGYKVGDGTAYSGAGEKNKTGKNSCGFGKLDSRWEKYYAALPSQVFDREKDCGRCIRVRGTNGRGDWTIVMVVDECASCDGNNDIDLSSPALKESTGFTWDRKTVEWEWTECSSGGRRMLRN